MILQDKQGSKKVDIIGLLIALIFFFNEIMKNAFSCFNEIGLAASVSFYFLYYPFDIFI